MTVEVGRDRAPEGVLARMWSRRSVLGAGVGGAAAVALSRIGVAQAVSSAPAGPHGPATPAAIGDLRWLVNRTSQGFTEALWAEAQTRGYQGFLEWQLDHLAIPDGALDALLLAYPTLTMTARQIQDVYVNNNMQGVAPNELKRACVLRATLSQRQLFERMVEFWTDHLNIDQNDGELVTLKTVDDREVVRAFALDTFPSLLDASAHSGAMLYYLDNYTNKATGVNENYAREVLELHTYGVGHYSEVEVREFARCLTGWSIFRQADPAYGTFRYVPGFHDTGAKTLLGLSIPAGGQESDGQTVLALLSGSPITAAFVARKLCRWMHSYSPPQSLVDQVAATYLATGGDVKAMLRVIFAPANSSSAQPKLKRPFQFAISLLRATQSPMGNPAALVTELVKLGQVPYAWGPPDGYPDDAEFWGQAVLPRWTFASRLMDGQANSANRPDVNTLLAGVPQAQVAARVDQILSGGTIDPAEVAEVHGYVMSFGSLTTQVRRDAFALMASSPSYQYY